MIFQFPVESRRVQSFNILKISHFVLPPPSPNNLNVLRFIKNYSYKSLSFLYTLCLFQLKMHNINNM